MSKYVIFWGYYKGKPQFESQMTIEDQTSEPTNPEDTRVLKFLSQEQAATHLQNYTHGLAEVLTIEQAKLK